MASITSYTITPPSGPYPPGSVVKISPVFNNPAKTGTFSGTLDGTPLALTLTAQEHITLGNVGDTPVTGLFVPSVDVGTLVNNGDGSYSWTLP